MEPEPVSNPEKLPDNSGATGAWNCPQCGELIEPPYKECSKCAADVKTQVEAEQYLRDARGDSTRTAAGKTASRLFFIFKLGVGAFCLLVAVAVYASIVASTHRRAQEAYRTAYAYSRSGSPTQAISGYSEAIRIDPNYFMAYTARASVYAREGDMERSIANYTKAIELNPKYALAYSGRASTYWSLGELEKSASDANRAIELDAAPSHPYITRGLAHLDKGELTEAIADFTQSIHRDTNITITFSNRAYAKLKNHDLDGALADSNIAIQIDAESLFAYSNRARVYREKGDWTNARADFTRNSTLKPKHTSEFLPRAYAWAALGNFENALQDCETANRTHPWDRWVDNTFASVYCMVAKSRSNDTDGIKARTEDVDHAFDYLEKGFEKGLQHCAYLKDDPDFEILHSDPRFQKLLDRQK